MRNVAYLVGIVVVVALGAHFASQLDRAGEPSFLLWVAAPSLLLAAVGLVRAHKDGVLKSWLSVRGGDFTRGFLGAAILFAAAWGFTKLVVPVGSPRESWLARLYLQLGDPSTLRKSVVFVVAAIVVVSIAEEIVWRGLVTSLLEEMIGSRRAWVWSAVLYSIAQLPTVYALRDPEAGWNPLVPIAALGAGLVWGFMARKFERLLPGIFSHILFDWTVVMMFRLWGPSV